MIGEIVAQNVDILCKQKGISKMEFYQDCEVSRGAFSQWKLGRTNPSMTNIGKMAEFFGISPNTLMSENMDTDVDDVYKKIDPPAKASESNEAKLLLSLLGDLSDEEVHETAKFIRYLKSQRSE